MFKWFFNRDKKIYPYEAAWKALRLATLRDESLHIDVRRRINDDMMYLENEYGIGLFSNFVINFIFCGYSIKSFYFFCYFAISFHLFFVYVFY